MRQMPKLDSRVLEKILSKECQLYEQYLSVLAQERDLITKIAAEQVMALSEKRGELTDAMTEAKNERIEFVKALGLEEKTPISKVVAEHCTAADKRKLTLLVNKLKNLVKTVRAQAKEFSQLLHFSLGMVDGSLSIIWAATQNVTKSYGADAMVKQSYTPKHSRKDLLLKEA